MDRASKDAADHHPEKPRHITELGRKDGPDQGACPRDRREMVAEEHPLGHGIIIVTVAEAMSGCDPGTVEGEDFTCQKSAVITVSKRENAKNDDEDRKRSHMKGRRYLYAVTFFKKFKETLIIFSLKSFG